MPPKKAASSRFQQPDQISADDKRKQGIIQWFRENPEPIIMKELSLKIAQYLTVTHSGTFPKTGVMQVENLVNELVEEEEPLIRVTKSGRNQLYYLFEGSEVIQLIAQLQDTARKVKTMKDGLAREQAQLAEASKGKEDTPERQILLKKQQLLLTKLAELEEEELLYRDSDPDLIQEIERRVENCYKAAEIWTDNVHLILRFYVNRGFCDGEMKKLREFFKIADNFDDDLPTFKPKSSRTKTANTHLAKNMAAHAQQPLMRKTPGQITTPNTSGPLKSTPVQSVEKK